MRYSLTLAAATVALAAAPALDAAPRKKAAVAARQGAAAEPQLAALPEAPYVPLTGCPAPAAGALAAAKKVDKKARGKFSIDKAPFISTLDANALCTNNQKMRAGAGDVAGSMGLSSQVMNTRWARMDLMQIPSLERELRPVLEAFAKAWPYAPLERTPKILFRADQAYQAQALPDNTIIVSMGLLESAQSDSELLFVLAHEYSHLLLGHFTKAETIAGARNATQAVSVAWQAGSAFSAMKKSGGGANMLVSAQSGMAAGARKAAPVAEALRFAVDDIFAPAWNRDQENEADALAIDLLIRSNMTIDSYANVFARLQKAFETEKASHDQREKAAEAVQKTLADTMKSFAGNAVSTTSFTSGGIRGLGSGLFKSAGGALLNNVGNITKSLGGDTHLPPEERRNGLAAYFQAGYPTADPPIDNGALIARIKATPDYGRAIALRNAYLKARGSYFAQDFPGATMQLRALGAGSRNAPTFVNYVAALAARDSGNVPMAASFFDAGRSGTGVPNLQLYETYTEMELGAGDAKDSAVLINEGKTRFRDPDHFKSIEIQRDLAMGDTAGAQTVYTACMQVKGREYITERCKAAMPQAAQQQSSPLGFKLPFGG